MRKFCLVVILLFTTLQLIGAQPLNMLVPFQSEKNPGYWKNKLPFPGYWQQDVHYKISAELDDSTNIITGVENLTYYNNSPDSLNIVYFHLYQNAFTPGSYMHKMFTANKQKVKFGKVEASGLGTAIDEIYIDGKIPELELYNTVLKVILPRTLKSGDSIVFNIKFRTAFDNGSLRRRMKMFEHNGFKHYDGVHWYPRIAVYDRYKGWNIDQHLGREFYGDYGTFDVSLTLPEQYILDGTGVMLNRNETLPADLRKKLDIKNFASKPIGEKPSIIIPASAAKKTWKFRAINVHDFAWTADPTYRIGEYEWNGVNCIALAQEENAAGWQTAAYYTASVISIYSEDFGMYGYPKIIVADARDGMEYPMMTLCGGTSPGYHFVIAHELGHQWFFGMVGNNETYRAFLDEGFTQFLSVWSLDKLSRVYDQNFPYWREYYLFGRYITDADNPNIPPGLNTHSDDFNGAIRHGGGYSQVYYKGGTMLYNLKYVLGDSLFLAAMQNYVSQFKYCHVYPVDFRESITQFTKLDLAWFFDQWFDTHKYIDYSVKKVKKLTKDSSLITFERKGGMEMPLKFTVSAKDGTQRNYYIPNQPDLEDSLSIQLPAWIGWGILNPKYSVAVKAEGGIKDVRIDTTNQMTDINLLNNSLHFPLQLKFDKGKYITSDRRYYQAQWRPDIWYNAIDGIKAGLHLEGNYFNRKHFLSASAWYNTVLLQWKKYYGKKPLDPISTIVSYSNNLFTENISYIFSAAYIDGIRTAKINFSKDVSDDNTFNISLRALKREYTEYALNTINWENDKWNNTLNAGFLHKYNAWGQSGTLDVQLTATTLFSESHYGGLGVEWKHFFNINKLSFRNRFYARYLSGSDVPAESKVYLASAAPEDLIDNKFYRSKGFTPSDWLGYNDVFNHLSAAGGLNLRAYSGYLAPYFDGDSTYFTYSGNGGASISIEMDFRNLFNIKPKKISNVFSIIPYVFYDAGIITYNKANIAPLRMDAGVGSIFTIKKWGKLTKAKPLNIRVDAPFFVNRLPYVSEKGYFDFRWVVGIGRSF